MYQATFWHDYREIIRLSAFNTLEIESLPLNLTFAVERIVFDSYFDKT